MYISRPCARRAHRNPPSDLYSPNVGNKYPIQIYILKNLLFLTPRPKGAQKTSSWHIFPKCWQFISNISMHNKKVYIPQPSIFSENTPLFLLWRTPKELHLHLLCTIFKCLSLTVYLAASLNIQSALQYCGVVKFRRILSSQNVTFMPFTKLRRTSHRKWCYPIYRVT